MSKHRHSKDRMFITYNEHKYGIILGNWIVLEWGGKKDPKKAPLTKLPFDCCALSLEPFQNPVCTLEGHIFDIMYCPYINFRNIVPFIKKYKRNPVNGKPLKVTDLIKLNFHKNENDEYHDPISFKVFTDYTKLIVIKTSGTNGYK
jgi:peptidyl-prolyl cis-trans isomerase-like protein 2